MSGLMSLTGAPVGTPLGAATSLVDRYTSLHATIGTLAALRHRDKTGEGQVVDCCLLDSGFTMVEIPLSYYLATGQEGGEGARPPYRKDGRPRSPPGARDGDKAVRSPPETSAVGGWTSRVGPLDSRGRRCQMVRRECRQHIVSTLLAPRSVAPVKTTGPPGPHLWEGCWSRCLTRCGETMCRARTIKMSKPRPGRRVPTPGYHRRIAVAILGYDAATLRELRVPNVIG
jgi:hypothetical protein